ncbi:MAG: OmpA family protein [Woeseiaceae bacterium]
MRILTRFVTATCFVVLWAGNAFAEAEPGQGYFFAMGSYVDDDDDRGVEDDITTGQFGFGYVLNDALNMELMLSAGWADGDSGGVDEEQLGIGVDLQWVFRRAERFSPYLHAGVGHLTIDPELAQSSDGGMYSVGAGFLLDMFDSNIALRGEYRHRADSATSVDLNDNMYSIGFQIPFGRATPKFVDADGDGVADGSDRCPNTPSGAPVDAYGCELDSDGDGVKDSMDKCPGTPRGVAVDDEGCPADSDGDGVSNDKDKCPNTVRGAKVGPDGCELDGDEDGVVDRLDECPNSAPGVQVDIKGCEIKGEIRLPGVNFESNSDRLLPGATSVLDDAVATLKKNPTITVEVAGHTDSDGAAEYNEGLSARRATTVRDYLASNGIAEGRLTVRGYGEAQPIADNGTREGKAENRRVVLRIIER